jgi:hypothetical protein
VDAVEQVLDGQVITAQERQEAEQTAELIREGLESIDPLVQRAWRERHWERLGYADWAAYIAAEFGADRLPARRALAALLSGEGLSERQISQATGVPRTTVQRDLGPGVAHSRATGTDQGKRNVDVTPPKAPKTTPKTGARRVQEHREREACDHSAGLMLVCRSCRQPDKAAGASFDAIEARHRQELEAKDEKIADLDAKLSAALEAAAQANPGDGLLTVLDGSDSALGSVQGTPGPKLDAAGEAMPDYEGESQVFGFDLDEDPGPDYGASQVPGRRR